LRLEGGGAESRDGELERRDGVLFGNKKLEVDFRTVVGKRGIGIRFKQETRGE